MSVKVGVHKVTDRQRRELSIPPFRTPIEFGPWEQLSAVEFREVSAARARQTHSPSGFGEPPFVSDILHRGPCRLILFRPTADVDIPIVAGRALVIRRKLRQGKLDPRR